MRWDNCQRRLMREDCRFDKLYRKPILFGEIFFVYFLQAFFAIAFGGYSQCIEDFFFRYPIGAGDEGDGHPIADEFHISFDLRGCGRGWTMAVEFFEGMEGAQAKECDQQATQDD